jgi:hypothetical protein
MKTLIFRCCTGLAIAIAAGAIGFFAGAQDTDSAKPERTLNVNEVARVGERVITAEEFIQRLVERERIYQDPDLRTATWALDSLLVDEMLRVECDRLEAWPKRRELDAEFASLNKAFEERLAEYNKGLTTPYTKEQYLEKKAGMTVLEFENQLKQVAKDNLERRLVVNYWLLSTDSADAEGLMMEEKDELGKIRARLLNGEKLGAIAMTNSDDMHTRASGGTIGTVSRQDGTFAPEVEQAFWNLEEGKWSEVIKTERGYWLVRKAKFYPGNQAPFFDLREECLKRPTPADMQMIRWRHALAASGRIPYERRMPGWDVQAGEK